MVPLCSDTMLQICKKYGTFVQHKQLQVFRVKIPHFPFLFDVCSFVRLTVWILKLQDIFTRVCSSIFFFCICQFQCYTVMDIFTFLLQLCYIAVLSSFNFKYVYYWWFLQDVKGLKRINENNRLLQVNAASWISLL